MNITKTEFAALAKVSPGRVSQWISEGKIGPDELEGEGRSAKIKLELACKKLKLRIDEERRPAWSDADRQRLELGSVMAEVIAAALLWKTTNGDPEADKTIEAVTRFEAKIAALPASMPHHAGNKRGPRPQYDGELARVHLIALANSVDGLPPNQTKIIDWLRDRLASEGSEAPSDSTLKRYVVEFNAWTSSLDRTALQRFQNSPALQQDFDSAEDYLQWHRIQERLAQRWLHDDRLQTQFTTPSDYIASVFENYSASDGMSCEGKQCPKFEI